MKKLICAIIILLAIISMSLADVLTDDDKVISGNSSRIFHRLNCRYSVNLDETNSQTFDTYQDAEATGLRPGLICKPLPAVIDPEPEPDPNVIIPLPLVPSIIIPNKGVVLGMDYCDYPYTGNTVGTPILIQQTFPLTLQEAIDQNKFPCLHFSPREDPTFSTIEPEEAHEDPNNTLVLDEYGRSPNYWSSYFYNIMTTLNYNQFEVGEVVFLSARQMDWLENIHAGYDKYKAFGAEDISEWDFYLERPSGEGYDMTVFLKKHIDDTLTTGKFVYGTFLSIEDYEIEELTAYQTLLQYALTYMEERYTLKQDEISYPITPVEYTDPVDYDQIVYTTDISKSYHSKDCGHFNGHVVKMINRETEIRATNDAIWYPESGLLSWRITPFELGDYIAIGDSDVGQAELAAVSARPKKLPTMEDVNKTWLKGNFDNVKFAEFSANYEGGENPALKISWVWEDGRWVPYGGVNTSGSQRILVKTEREIIDSITEKYRTIKVYERPLSQYSDVWETTKREVTEITTIVYVREVDVSAIAAAKSYAASNSSSGNNVEWVFDNGKWKPIHKELIGLPDDYGDLNEEELLAAKPVAPVRPDPNAVNEGESTLRALAATAGDLAPMIEGLISTMDTQGAYEEQLMQYGVEYEEYEKRLASWQEMVDGIEERESERLWFIDNEEERYVRMHEEQLYIEEENRIEVLTELLEDYRMTDEYKGTIREMLNAIRDNPINEADPNNITTPTG